MKIQTTGPFDEDYDALPESIKNKADKQFVLLLENPHHPSLQTKKIKGHPNIWEGRVTKSYCFTFQISGDTYILRRIGTHENGASLRIICMKKQMKTLAKTVIIFHEKYNANIPRISYADPS